MKRIGIALGGGGARGFAHIGVLRILQQQLGPIGRKIEVVTGTSIGALVGAVFASGTLEQLAKSANEIKLTDIPRLLSPSWPISGVFSGKNVLELLNEFLTADRIEELPLKYAAVSVDLKRGEPVTHSSGDLKQAIRASIAIPGVFSPVCTNSQVLVDGGICEPVPVLAARELGAEFVIAVDLFGNYSASECSPLSSALSSTVNTAMQYVRSIPGMKSFRKDEANANNENQLMSLVEVIERSFSIGQAQLTRSRLRESPPDLVIAPALGSVGLLDFHRGTALIEAGGAATEAILPELLQRLA